VAAAVAAAAAAQVHRVVAEVCLAAAVAIARTFSRMLQESSVPHPFF
jgi:hypothetical protein